MNHRTAQTHRCIRRGSLRTRERLAVADCFVLGVPIKLSLTSTEFKKMVCLLREQLPAFSTSSELFVPFHIVVLKSFAAERLLYAPYRTALAVPLWECFEDIVFNKPLCCRIPNL